MEDMVKRSFGISMSPELARKVEKPLTYGDARSERIRDLIRLGLHLEEEMKDNGIWTPDHTAKKRVISEGVGCIRDLEDSECDSGSGISADGSGSCSE